MKNHLFLIALAIFILAACNQTQEPTGDETEQTEIDNLLSKYTSFRLEADISSLSDNEKQMIPLLIEAAKIMDECFWYEAYGDKDELMASIEMDGVQDEKVKEFARINYGPWDRLNNNEPFVPGVGPKPAGANFYPTDMTKEEFEASDLADKASLYTFLRRDDAGN